MDNYRDYSDQELFHLLQDDDRGAFAEIYNRYKGPLFIHAFHRLRDREECKDLIQQLFAVLWDNRNSIILNGHLSGYLYTAVRNRVFKIIARQNVASNYIDAIAQIADAGTCITDHRVRENQLMQIIEKEIAGLPPKMREVFELSRKNYWSHKEIAEQLELSEKTVRNQVNNALKILRVKLGTLVILICSLLLIK